MKKLHCIRGFDKDNLAIKYFENPSAGNTNTKLTKIDNLIPHDTHVRKINQSGPPLKKT